MRSTAYQPYPRRRNIFGRSCRRCRPRSSSGAGGPGVKNCGIRGPPADESFVDGLLRNAERILETAAAAKDDEAQDCTICITRLGGIHILAEPAGWSLPALAADL